MQPTDAVVFSHVVESLHVRAMKNRLDASTRQQLRGLGIDPEQRLLPAYPLEVWDQSIHIAARCAFPHLPAEKADFELGKIFIQEYEATLLGKALFSLLRLMSAERIIDRMAKNFRSGTSYTETRTTRVGDQCVELWMSHIAGAPEFTRGVLVAGLECAGVREPQVERAALQGADGTFRIRWKA